MAKRKFQGGERVVCTKRHCFGLIGHVMDTLRLVNGKLVYRVDSENYNRPLGWFYSHELELEPFVLLEYEEML